MKATWVLCRKEDWNPKLGLRGHHWIHNGASWYPRWKIIVSWSRNSKVSLTFDTVQWVCWLSWVPNSSVQKISQDLEFYSWGNFLEGITLATNDQAQYINRSGPQFPLRSHISVLLCVHQHQPASCPSYHVQLHRPGIYACFQATPAAAKCCGEQSRISLYGPVWGFSLGNTYSGARVTQDEAL